MSKTKQLWTLGRFQLAATPWVLILVLGSGLPCFTNLVLSNATNVPASLELLLGNQLIYFVLIFAPQLLVPELGNSGKVDFSKANASGMEFLLTRAVDMNLLYRSRSLLFFFLLLIIPLLGLVASLFHHALRILVSNGSLFHSVLREIPKSIALGPNTQDIPRDFLLPNADTIFLPYGNILLGTWYVWLPLCFGIVTLTLLTAGKTFRYFLWVLFPVGCALVVYYSFPSVFSPGSTALRGGGLSPNIALFLFYASHESLCWLLAIPALLLSLFWYENETGELK